MMTVWMWPAFKLSRRGWGGFFGRFFLGGGGKRGVFFFFGGGGTRKYNGGGGGVGGLFVLGGWGEGGGLGEGAALVFFRLGAWFCFRGGGAELGLGWGFTFLVCIVYIRRKKGEESPQERKVYRRRSR